MLDTPPEEALDDITLLAANLCGTPIALVSLVDRHRLWFKSRVGTDMEEASRTASFCACALEDSGLTIVPDARVDPRFAESPLVTGAAAIRFYAGAPLVSPEGAALGDVVRARSGAADFERGAAGGAAGARAAGDDASQFAPADAQARGAAGAAGGARGAVGRGVFEPAGGGGDRALGGSPVRGCECGVLGADGVFARGGDRAYGAGIGLGPGDGGRATARGVGSAGAAGQFGSDDPDARRRGADGFAGDEICGAERSAACGLDVCGHHGAEAGGGGAGGAVALPRAGAGCGADGRVEGGSGDGPGVHHPRRWADLRAG